MWILSAVVQRAYSLNRLFRRTYGTRDATANTTTGIEIGGLPTLFVAECSFSVFGFGIPYADQVVERADVHSPLGDCGGRVRSLGQRALAKDYVFRCRLQHDHLATAIAYAASCSPKRRAF